MRLVDCLLLDFDRGAGSGRNFEVSVLEGDGMADKLTTRGALRDVELDELGSALKDGEVK